jgi:protein-disulfide isomerase
MPDQAGSTPAPGPRRTVFRIAATVVAVIVVVVAAVVAYNAFSSHDKPAVASGDAKAIRVASDSVRTKDGSTEPKVVLSLYEDFLCPHCRRFEEAFGPTVNQLIDSGTVAADYYMVAILDSPQTDNYSSRAGGAAYCVGQGSVDAFRRFHSALYAQQPSETAATFPTDAQLVDTARRAGANTDAADCITERKFVPMVQGLVRATGIRATPTVRINGTDYDLTSPDDLAQRVKEIAAR